MPMHTVSAYEPSIRGDILITVPGVQSLQMTCLPGSRESLLGKVVSLVLPPWSGFMGLGSRISARLPKSMPNFDLPDLVQELLSSRIKETRLLATILMQ